MQGRIVLVALTIAMGTALAQDAMCVDIIYPPPGIDSNTTITPVVDVKNNGSEPLPNVPVSFNIVSEPADTIFFDSANSGQIDAGASKRITFADSCTPGLGVYTMTCITELPGDTNRHNDTLMMPLFVRYLDVAVEIVSPRDTVPPGPVPVIAKLTNLGDMPTLVPRVDVQSSGNYGDFLENVAIPVGSYATVAWTIFLEAGDTETCMVWITFPADENHHNDTDVVIVNAAGIQDRVESQPRVGMRLELSPSPMIGSVLSIEYSLYQAGPASITLFDIKGRAVIASRLDPAWGGKSSLDLRGLRSGIYLARLDDGRSSVTQKLVVQR